MVGHHRMNRVLRATLRHVAVDASAFASLRRGKLTPVYIGMATFTDRDVVLCRRPASRNIVRIVTRDARHLALLKTRRLPETVAGAVDLELVVVTGSRRVIEVDDVIAERLARDERKRRAFVPADLKRQQAARRFEVALQAGLELPLAAE